MVPSSRGRYCDPVRSASPPPGSSTILIVDDHPVLRHGLAALLQAEPWVGRLVEAATVAEAAERAVTEHPDLALVDLELPDGDGVQLIGRLHRSVPGCAVLVLTMRSDQGSVRACLEAGAAGYVLKTTEPSTLVRAVRTVLDGGLVLGPGVRSGSLAGEPRPALAPPLDHLSATDLRLLALVADGGTNAEIAQAFGISDKTVRNRVSQLLSRLGVVDRVQAALLARDRGLTAGLPDRGGPAPPKKVDALE